MERVWTSCPARAESMCSSTSWSCGEGWRELERVDGAEPTCPPEDPEDRADGDGERVEALLTLAVTSCLAPWVGSAARGAFDIGSLGGRRLGVDGVLPQPALTARSSMDAILDGGLGGLCCKKFRGGVRTSEHRRSSFRLTGFGLMTLAAAASSESIRCSLSEVSFTAQMRSPELILNTTRSSLSPRYR